MTQQAKHTPLEAELLAALKALVNRVPHAVKANAAFNQAWNEARAAIEKAEGR